MNIDVSQEAWIKDGRPSALMLVLADMRRHWRPTTSLWASCVAAAIILAFAIPNYWRVETVVMPVSSSNGVNLSSALAGGLGSLAGGLGALLGRPASGQEEALAVLRSRELFDAYAQKKNLLPVLYASQWDANTGTWKGGFLAPPSLRQAFKLFDTKIRDIDVDRRTGVITLSITWKDRAQAVQWARDLVDLTNQQLRERALTDAKRNMDYLSGEMRLASAGGAENALTVALANSYDREAQSYMFAKGQNEFAFRVIDPPTIPDVREHVWPHRTIFILLGFLLGATLSAGLAVWRLRAQLRAV